MICAQSGLFYWKKQQKRSYELVSCGLSFVCKTSTSVRLTCKSHISSCDLPCRSPYLACGWFLLSSACIWSGGASFWYIPWLATGLCDLTVQHFALLCHFLVMQLPDGREVQCRHGRYTLASQATCCTCAVQQRGWHLVRLAWYAAALNLYIAAHGGHL